MRSRCCRRRRSRTSSTRPSTSRCASSTMMQSYASTGGGESLPNTRLTMAWTVGGMSSSPSVAGRSRSSMPVDSTMKNGLPPARPVMALAWSSRTRPPPALRTSSVASSSDSGSKRMQTWFTAPVPQVGRSSNRSVRVATTTSTRPGPWRARAATRSIRSSICGRNVCASSKSRVTGRSLASPSIRVRKPARTSWTNADSSRRGSLSPSNDWSRFTVRASGPGGHTRWTSSRSRCTATPAGSSSSMPATSRTIAAAGANVALSAPRWRP